MSFHINTSHPLHTKYYIYSTTLATMCSVFVTRACIKWVKCSCRGDFQVQTPTHTLLSLALCKIMQIYAPLGSISRCASLTEKAAGVSLVIWVQNTGTSACLSRGIIEKHDTRSALDTHTAPNCQTLCVNGALRQPVQLARRPGCIHPQRACTISIYMYIATYYHRRHFDLPHKGRRRLCLYSIYANVYNLWLMNSQPLKIACTPRMIGG